MEELGQVSHSGPEYVIVLPKVLLLKLSEAVVTVERGSGLGHRIQSVLLHSGMKIVCNGCKLQWPCVIVD